MYQKNRWIVAQEENNYRDPEMGDHSPKLDPNEVSSGPRLVDKFKHIVNVLAMHIAFD